MSFELLIYTVLSFLSILLAILYFIYPNRVLPIFFVFGLMVPTSNQFMSYISLSGVYFFDYFFFLISIYYFISLLINKKIFKKNIVLLIIGLFVMIFYSLLAYSNSINIDKYLFRDLRPFLTLFYALIFTASLRFSIISFKSLTNSLICVFISKILFFIVILFGFSFDDQYYQNNIFRYFDAVTFIASLILIYYILMRQRMLTEVSKIKINFILILAIIIILISNLRILILALLFVYLFYSKSNFFRKSFYLVLAVSFFLLYSHIMSANRVLDSNKSEIVALQLVSRFAPAIEKVIQMKPYEYIYGLGIGTYFEIPWFEYRALDTKLNTIDSTYLTLFVKYGLFSILIFILFFRLLLFNINNTRIRKSIFLFYCIVFLTISSLYQSGTVFHFLFINLWFLSLKNENTSRSISVSS